MHGTMNIKIQYYDITKSRRLRHLHSRIQNLRFPVLTMEEL